MRRDAFTILLGGELTPTPRLAACTAGTRVIAADSGIRHAAALGLVPELWTGDFDSVDAAMAAPHAGVPREVFPAAKDFTDGELAVEAAIARGARRLVLAGAFGGPRADHAFLHLAMGMRLAEAGYDVHLTSGNQEGTPLLPGELRLDYPPGTLVSVLALSDLSGLDLEGVRWPLKDRTVPFGSSLTLSNEVTEGFAARLRTGRAMVVAHPAFQAKSAE